MSSAKHGGHNALDLAGQVFGSLTVVRRAESRSDGHTRWLCRCACGREVYARSGELTGRDRVSCGCARKGPRAVATEPRKQSWVEAKMTSSVDGVPAIELAARHGVSEKLLRDRLHGATPLMEACTTSPTEARSQRIIGTKAAITRLYADAATRAGEHVMERRGKRTVATPDVDTLTALAREGYAVRYGETDERTPDLLVALRRARTLAARGTYSRVVRVSDGAILAARTRLPEDRGLPRDGAS